MHQNEIIINGRRLDLRKLRDRSVAFQYIKDAMVGCETDYVEAKGDFKIS